MKPSFFAIILLLAACSGDKGRNGRGAQSPRQGTEVFAVQVGAFSDSSLASRLMDSLSMAGWQAYLSPGDSGATYRVLTSPSRSALLTNKVAHALRADSVDAFSVVDTSAVEPLVDITAVNGGSHGITSRVRWLVAPNGRSILVVHDASGVEAEALPDGFVFASELNGVLFQRNGVWDVAPSPSWTKVVYGEAFRFSEEKVLDGLVVDSLAADALAADSLAADSVAADSVAGDSLAANALVADVWATVARAAGMPVDSVRANAYPVSGMAIIYGYSRPVIVDLAAVDSITGVPTPQSHQVPVSGGWRVRWTPDTTRIAIGDAPVTVQDASPPRNWLTVDRGTGEVRGTISRARTVPLDWRLGPALDVSVPIDVQSSRSIRLEGATITSNAGWIRRDGKIVGPGVALAATRDGRFVVALAPRVGAKDYESALEPVVYKIGK